MSSTEAKAARIPQPPPGKKYCLVYIKSYFSYISYVSLQNPCAIGVLRLSGLIIKILFFERKILFSYVPRHIVELRAGILPLWTPSSPLAGPLLVPRKSREIQGSRFPAIPAAKKRRQTLDRPPPMLYNGVAKGNCPRRSHLWQKRLRVVAATRRHFSSNA